MSALETTRRVYFVELHISNTPLYLNSSGQSLYWDNSTSGGLTPNRSLQPNATLTPNIAQEKEWLGVGALGTISGLGEDTDMGASQITLGISGVGNEVIEELQTNTYQGQLVFIYQNDLSENYRVENSEIVWIGRMDTANIELGDTATVQMNCESALARWNKASPRRMNDQTQQRLHTGDLGLMYTAIIGNVSIKL